MSLHIHGRPDNQDEWLDDTIGKGPGDPDLPSGGRWVGTEIPEVKRYNFYDNWSSRQAYTNKWRLPPELEDSIDYDPRFDEDLEKEN